MRTSIIFFGTNDFAATILNGIIRSSLFNIKLVITQPDRPAGRKQEMQVPPVKLLSDNMNITVSQPKSLKNFEFSKTDAQLFVVAQYGLLIPKQVLDLPLNGTINVHTSLLPKYRGASPIQSAIINGENKTGVTIMLMNEGIDTGPILSQREIQIDPDDTYFSLDKKMACEASNLLLETIPRYLSCEINPVTQDDSKATLCKKLERDDGHIDWNKSEEEIYNLYRGLHPWPGVWSIWNGKRLKLLSIKKSNQKIEPGKIITINNQIFVGCGMGSIEIIELQLEGKQWMTAAEFMNGYKNFHGSVLE